ncbi:MAG: hypothetical protein GX103_03135 [Bacteroidales bacterium]|nr:hypothetical protein [Bacteroidales bacterium]
MSISFSLNSDMRFNILSHGFAAGAMGSLAGSYVPEDLQLISAAAIGGTAASISGGKFANGAITGAYVVLFNHLMHQGQNQNENDTQKVDLTNQDTAIPDLIEKMEKINNENLSGDIKEIIDLDKIEFGKHERYKVFTYHYDDHYLNVTIVNPIFKPDQGYYYRVSYRDYSSFGRSSFGQIDISGDYSVISIKIFNEQQYNEIYNKIF